MTSYKEEPEGLRDSVFNAIQGFTLGDRVSMSPATKVARTSSYRVNTSSRSPIPLNKTRLASDSCSSLSMGGSDNISFKFNKESSSSMASLSRRTTSKSTSQCEPVSSGRLNMSAVSSRSIPTASIENIPPVPKIVITPAEPEPKIIKAPPASEVGVIDKQTMVDWLQCLRKGSVENCEKMLDKMPQLANYTPPYYYNYAAIHIATVQEHPNLIELLYKRGADLNAQTMTGRTALHLAVECKNKEIGKLLIRLGANPHLTDLKGQPYSYYLKDDEKTPDITLRNNNNKPVVPRPPSQGSMDSTLDKSGFVRKASFRDAMKKFVRRSPSPTVPHRSHSGI